MRYVVKSSMNLSQKKIFNPEKVNALGEALAKASEQIIDAFSSAFSGLFDDKN